MRAIVMTQPRQVEVVDDWPEPRATAGEVIVRMRAVGLCGSDLGVYDGTRATPALPWVMGHEGGGEIVAVGPGVTDRHVGQRVVIEPNYCCFACRHCRRGLTSACAERRIVGMNIPGLLAERVAAPARFTWPVPATVPDEALACAEPLAVARAAVRRAGVGDGDECLVVGAGSQGLFVCQALLAAGAQPFVTEPHEGRLALAESIGAKPLDPGDARDFPFVFDTAGVPAAWRISTSAAAPTGVIVMIGMSSQPVELSTLDITRRQLVVRGSLIYDHPGDFADTVATISDDVISPARVLWDGSDPAQAADAFARARSAPGKSWINLARWQEAQDG